MAAGATAGTSVLATADAAAGASAAPSVPTATTDAAAGATAAPSVPTTTPGTGALTAFDATLGDSPLLALARQEWLTWHHRTLALAVAACWPLPGDSKSLRSCRSEGLLPGLQGLHARFLLGMQSAQTTAVDALLPYAPGAEAKDAVKELVSWGMAPDAATRLSVQLTDALATAATACATLRAHLVTGTGAAGGAAAGGGGGGGAADAVAAAAAASAHAPTPDRAELPPCGTLRLLPLKPSATAAVAAPDALLLLVYEPDPAAAAAWLAPVRASAAVPAGSRLFGPLNMPLYAAASRPDIAAALAGARVAVTPFTSVLAITAAHYAKLSLMHRLAAAGVRRVEDLPPVATGSVAPATLLRRVFCLLARYEAYTGNASGLQGAVPHHVFDALERACGVTAECFASPLNAHFPAFCSAFPDTDAPFGSVGSFFAWRPRRGVYEANPPFVNGVMLAMARHLGELLDAAAAGREPLAFYVIVPAWRDAYFHQLLAASRHTRARRELLRKEHEYIDGLQHRAGRTTWGANVDSTLFLLATDAAVAALPGGHAGGGGSAAVAAVWDNVVAAFHRPAAAADPAARNFTVYPIPAADWPTVPQ